MCKRGWLLPVFYILISAASYLSWRFFISINRMLSVFEHFESSGQDVTAFESIRADFLLPLISFPKMLCSAFLCYVGVVFIVMAFLVVLLGKEQKSG